MKSIEAYWRAYRDKCFPEGMPARQSGELRQAFFAGALVTLQEMSALADLPEEQAVAGLHAMHKEAIEFCELMAGMGRGHS